MADKVTLSQALYLAALAMDNTLADRGTRLEYKARLELVEAKRLIERLARAAQRDGVTRGVQ